MEESIKGLRVERTKTGITFYIDNSFEGPVILKQDRGLGFLEPCLEISREGHNPKFKSITMRKYLGDGFTLAVKCDCGEVFEVSDANKCKQCWGVCKCGAILINPFYEDPVGKSWQCSADLGEAYM